MEQPAFRYSSQGAGSSNRSSPSYSSGPSSSNRRNASSVVPQPRGVPDLHGRARKKAELERLTQEIRLLEDELSRLDTLPPASDLCRELVQSIDSHYDPLLANSIPQAHWDPHWERWFRGPPVPRSTCCCIPTRRI